MKEFRRAYNTARAVIIIHWDWFCLWPEPAPQEVYPLNSCFSDIEIEELAEGLIRQYLGQQREIPLWVDIEGFLTSYLGLPLKYRSFAEDDCSKIGFISDGVTPLRVMNGHRPIREVFPKGTVVLEKWLLTHGEEGRRRFTVAHEAGHYIMDRTVTMASFHREYDRERIYSPQELKELLSFRETRVDRLAAALLMPRYMVQAVLKSFGVSRLIPIYGCNLLRLEDKLLVQKMSGAMGVSYTAFLIRLKELNLLKRHDISEYIASEIGLGNGVMAL